MTSASEVIEAARGRGLTIATAESCTGGLVCAALTSVAGASAVVLGGIVAYANATKSAALGVDAALIEAHGAVSEEVALAMAAGARTRLNADLAVSVTGIAGPGGGSPEKPVGLVWFGIADAKGAAAREIRFGDLGREGVRTASVDVALGLLSDRISQA